VKALKKKLRQIADIRGRSNAGVTLTPGQIHKLSSEGPLKKQLVVLERQAPDTHGNPGTYEDEDTSDCAENEVPSWTKKTKRGKRKVAK
jgi:hypothetical protein